MKCKTNFVVFLKKIQKNKLFLRFHGWNLCWILTF